jgi:hypothetical protein
MNLRDMVLGQAWASQGKEKEAYLLPKSTDKGMKNAVSTNNHGLSRDFALSPIW